LPPTSTLFPYTTLFRSPATSPANIPVTPLSSNPFHHLPLLSLLPLPLHSSSLLFPLHSPPTSSPLPLPALPPPPAPLPDALSASDRKSTRLNSSHRTIS